MSKVESSYYYTRRRCSRCCRQLSVVRASRVCKLYEYSYMHAFCTQPERAALPLSLKCGPRASHQQHSRYTYDMGRTDSTLSLLLTLVSACDTRPVCEYMCEWDARFGRIVINYIRILIIRILYFCSVLTNCSVNDST